ncbi:P27 family phage terminase small subunit [bacterium]|nr:P27 family phage terminase small subunit [bacterium]
MSQKKRSDKNSVTAALGGFKGAIESVPLPQGVELRSEDEMVIWDQFTRARAREDWRDMDLLLLAKVVRMEADIRQHQAAVEAQGVIIENQRGTPIPNPLLAIIDTVERRQLAVIRSMSLNQQARSIEPPLLLSGANY